MVWLSWQGESNRVERFYRFHCTPGARVYDSFAWCVAHFYWAASEGGSRTRHCVRGCFAFAILCVCGLPVGLSILADLFSLVGSHPVSFAMGAFLVGLGFESVGAPERSAAYASALPPPPDLEQRFRRDAWFLGLGCLLFVAWMLLGDHIDQSVKTALFGATLVGVQLLATWLCTVLVDLMDRLGWNPFVN